MVSGAFIKGAQHRIRIANGTVPACRSTSVSKSLTELSLPEEYKQAGTYLRNNLMNQAIESIFIIQHDLCEEHKITSSKANPPLLPLDVGEKRLAKLTGFTVHNSGPKIPNACDSQTELENGVIPWRMIQV
ncbi:hypothetical protein LguiB_032415 [Lonicera macranthoides]